MCGAEVPLLLSSRAGDFDRVDCREILFHLQHHITVVSSGDVQAIEDDSGVEQETTNFEAFRDRLMESLDLLRITDDEKVVHNLCNGEKEFSGLVSLDKELRKAMDLKDSLFNEPSFYR